MLLPDAFTRSTQCLLGEAAFARLTAALDEDAPVSIRLNRARMPEGLTLPTRRVPWSEDGFYLGDRPAFTFDPLLHAGCYYVQEASSMFLRQVMQQHLPDRPLCMLDLCAAPGGKSTHACGLLPEGSLLVANEVIRPRAQVLAENLTKWGRPDVVVTGSDPSAFGTLGGMFDVVLADVPCSGEGMFRKDEGAVAQWSPEGVTLCAGRQRRIIADAWPALRPGGLLIYSTCTYNVHENEENVQWICSELGAEALPVAVPDSWRITGNLLPKPSFRSAPNPSSKSSSDSSSGSFPVYRFLPHLTRGEGLFMAVLRKADRPDAETSSVQGDAFPFYNKANKAGKKANKGANTTPSLSTARSLIHDWLDRPERYDALVQGTQAIAFPRPWSDSLRRLQSAVYILRAGIPLAELRGRDLLPTHALAMSTALRPDAFPRAELDYPQALAYLRREAIALPATTPRGHVLVTFRSIPLGFVKNLGPRANNLYPQDWRIRTTHGPDVEVRVL